MRQFDAAGNPVYCAGSGTLIPGGHNYGRGACPVCGLQDVLITAVSELRKHFPPTLQPGAVR